MTTDIRARIAQLSTRPTERHPFGLRHGVEERAAILIYDAGVPEDQADAFAWELEVNGGQRGLFG